MNNIKRFKKLKNIVFTAIFTVMLCIASVFIASCANDQTSITITPSVEKVNIIVGQDSSVFFTVQDFKFDGSVEINVFDQSISGQDTTSGHISFTQTYNNSGVTTLNITGLSGGTSTIVATTKEGGNKTAQIIVEVGEYSNSLQPKDDLFVLTEGEELRPSADNFIFSDQATEKKLNFYYIDEDYSIFGDHSKIENSDIEFVQFDDGYYTFNQANGENLLATKEFTSVKLDKSDENNVKMIFTQTSMTIDGGHQTFEVENINDTQGFYFITEYQNQTTRKDYYVVIKFTAFLGIDANDFKVFDEDMNEADSFSLITYSTEELSKERVIIETPFYLDDLANPNLVFEYDLNEEDFQKVSFNLLSSSQVDGKMRYVFDVTPKVTYKTTANINLYLYYKGYKTANNTEVSLTKVLPVSILVAPKELSVNDKKVMDVCEFYNGNIGDYGWKEFNISVYPEDASYDGVTIYFDQEVIEVKQGTQNLRSGMKITDISIPVMIRGSYFAEPGVYQGENAIKLVLEKHELLVDEISYMIPFEIKPCATKIEFLREEYNYSPENLEYGIYVSTSKEESLFGGIYADKDFTNVEIKYFAGERKVQIEYYGKDVIVQDGETKYVMILKVKPLGIGLQTVTIYLDNGRSISATFRVVDTFDYVTIKQDRINRDNTGTVSVINKVKSGDDDTGLDIVIRNGTEELNKYGKICSVSISSNNGTDVINSISYPNYSQNNVLKVEAYQDEKGAYKIITNTFGNERVDFVVRGVMVDENFILTEISKTLNVDVNSYNPAKSIKIYKKDESELASQLILYSHSQKIISNYLDIAVDGTDVYNLYNPKTHNYDATLLTDENKAEYVYWTSNLNIERGGVSVSSMEYGSVYNIGGYALFNTTNLSLTAIKPGGNFTIYANIRQYDLLVSFAINVKTEEYIEVESIDTNISTDKIIFNSRINNYSFVVNTFDPSVATNCEIELIFEEIDGCLSPLKNNIGITNINNGSWMVSLNLIDSIMPNITYKTKLIVAAKDWISSNNPSYFGYETKVKTYVIEYQNGTIENPYDLISPSDILSISKDSHYKLSRTIDMSAYVDTNEFKSLQQMTFNGSIVGDKNARIIGLNIRDGYTESNENYYGLFKTLSSSAKIKNITFEGTFKNIEISENTAYIGLLAGKNDGTIENVSVILSGSNVEIVGGNGAYIGGIVGQNNGIIKKNSALGDAMTTALFKEVLNITNSSNSDVFAGGICGENLGQITDIGEKSNYGLNGYTTYTLIEVSNTGTGKVYAGGVSGQNNGYITNLLIGGKLASISNNVYVGGVSAKQSNGEVSDITTRTLVRGANVGVVTANFTGGTIEDIVVEAVDDGKSINQEASMIVKYGSNTQIDDSTIVCGQTNKDFTNVQLNTYVSRRFENNFTNSIDDYCGDFIVLNGNEIVAHKEFTSQSASVLSINANVGFVEMTPQSETTNKMFTAYYFEAQSYLKNGNYTTVNLQDVQKLLDENLNKVSIDSLLCPFKIVGADYFTIISENSLISIDKNGNLLIKGTGIGKLVISSTLNARYKQVVYLNILNYFNNNALNSKSIYVSEDIRILYGQTTATIYSLQNTIIQISPILKSNSEDYGFFVSENGDISINNTEIKLLSKSEGFGVTIEPSSLEYASYEVSSDMIIFSKKIGLEVPQGTTETIKLTTSITKVIEGVKYIYDAYSKPTIVFSYFEGTKNVLTNFDNYILSSTGRALDQVVLDSDDANNEVLNYKILRNGVEIQNNETTDNLFNIKINSQTTLKHNIQISVNKKSIRYKNRYDENIFGQYVIRFMGKTNQDKVYKDIIMTLTDEYLEGIVIENYANVETLIRSDKVIPAQYGLISVNILPTDFEFTTFELINDPINYTEGSTNANFEVGYLNSNGQFVQFVQIDGAIYKNNGVIITKKALIEGIGEEKYDGQFYIRYLFKNSTAVKDGNRVSLTARLKKLNEEVYSEELNYTIYKKYIFDVTLNGKTQENIDENQKGYYVARGISYEIDIENSGYDTNSIEISTSNPNYIQVTNENGKYVLYVSERAIDDQSIITLNAQASRIDASGKEYVAKVSFVCKIMEYVINYSPNSSDLCYDIISGYEDGNLIVPLGTTNKLSVDMGNGKYIEYNPSLSGVLEKVNKFLDDAATKGKWNVYTDIDNESLPERFGRNSSEKLNYVSSKISNSSQIENKYFTFNGLSYSLNSEHDPYNLKHYMFTYEANYEPGSNGEYEVLGNIDQTSSKFLYSEFSMFGYIRGSEEAPNPIRDYNGLKSMLNGAHYILTNDIYITPETFEPINGVFASFDGNAHSIIFEPGEYDVTSFSDVGIFSQISSESTIKNLKVVFNNTNGKVSFVTTDTASTIFGVIAARNNGNITNAKVTSSSGGSIEFNYNSTSTPSAGSYVAGICAINSGNITNSQVTISMTTTVSLAGIVGQNNGIIASSYYKNGILKNTSNENTKFYTAGVAIANAENGKILTSYSSGVVSNKYIYSYDTRLSRIDSTVQNAGFIYSNLGVIRDCYSNIPLNTSSSTAGFVYENAGEITNCFTTSVILNKNNQNNHYFAGATNIAGTSGVFESCYYLKDQSAQYLGTTGNTEAGINLSLASEVIENVNELNVEGFGSLNNFESFAYGESSLKYNNVWMFIATNSTVLNDEFKETVITTSPDTGKYISSSYNNQVFAGGRLELVSANILACSFREMDESKTKTEDGVTTYFYDYMVNQYGTKLNPYIINSAENFENNMTSYGISKENSGSFRFVSNIDYGEYDEVVTTQKVTLYGIIEGNGMTVKNIDMTGSETLKSAGFIGSVSGGLNKLAGVMNLDIVPRIVNFPNANFVGALTGTLQNANISNISILNGVSSSSGEEASAITVSGKNIVGGVAGLVVGSANINNITSKVGSKALRIVDHEALVNGIYGSSNNIDNYSYAGGVFGYVYAQSAGKAVNIKDIKFSSRDANIIGVKAGFAFGGISRNVEIRDVNLTVGAEMIINAYKFGGLVAGESAGDLTDVNVKGTNYQMAVFSTKTFKPMAVGGIFGFMICGKLKNVQMNQSFNIENNGDDTIDYVGGIAGYANTLTFAGTINLENIVMSADISTRGVLGGIIGFAETQVTMNKVAIRRPNEDQKFKVEGKLMIAYAGGFVGISTQKVKITDAYSKANIEIEAYVYNSQITANVGSIVGKFEDAGFGEFENIYTTTQYKIKLEDKKAYGESHQVTGAETGISYDLNGVVNKNNDSTKSVYHWLSSTVITAEPGTVPRSTTFFAKKDASTVHLNQNENGYSIVQYVNDQTSALPLPKHYFGLMTKEDEHGLIVDKDNWVNSKDSQGKYNDYPYLAFEINL